MKKEFKAYTEIISAPRIQETLDKILYKINNLLLSNSTSNIINIDIGQITVTHLSNDNNIIKSMVCLLVPYTVYYKEDEINEK